MGAGEAPLIGLPCFSGELTGTHRPIYGVNQTYANALIAEGVTPLLIPPGLSTAALESLCARLDGLLLPGGADIEPARYGEARMPECGRSEPERDELELALTDMALRRDLPILGICRGMQTLNVAIGGTLNQDIEALQPGAMPHAHNEMPRDYRAHSILVERDSRLGEIFGATELQVNSLHHQSVKRVGAAARIVAWSSDGVAEGMELPGQRFAVAVQYHPEELVATDELSQRLFAAFAQACRER